MTETQPENRRIGDARVSTYGQILAAARPAQGRLSNSVEH